MFFKLKVMKTLDTKGREYDEKHPEIWTEFVRIAKVLKSKGHKRYSARGIFEVIRFEAPLTLFDEYKVNNNFTKYYALKLMKEYKEFEGFFEIRN